MGKAYNSGLALFPGTNFIMEPVNVLTAHWLSLNCLCNGKHDTI